MTRTHVSLGPRQEYRGATRYVARVPTAALQALLLRQGVVLRHAVETAAAAK